ncbi:glycosyltransferase [Rhodoferax sp. 4810]|uniref:Glycosyltransferase n=1 Tax=Thiospirillum jenense TaxID=1653858 RepID=A0A839HDE5_9GAMM|nr:glycosyltransferase [Thiospirillum jenense]MBB1074204.1 glycosyltransferase [Rhodoferax jenense]MBB1125278.1 glycosyltransferase [Thiospirillum jenense]
MYQKNCRHCEILIPVYNGDTQVRRCITSVLKTAPSFCTVTILDDASTDWCLLDWLKQQTIQDARLKLISHQENLGFVGNVNRGLAAATSDVIVLNSDTIVTAHWVEKLYTCANSNAKIGIVCPLSNYATILSVPDMNRNNPLPTGLDISSFAQLIETCANRSYPRLPVAVGFCMLIRFAVLKQVGLLHTAFHRGYGEECDLSLRTWQAGFEIACCDDCFVYHAGEGSFATVVGMAPIKKRNEQTLQTRWPFYNQLIQCYCQINPLLDTQERIKTALCHHQGDSAPHLLQVLHAYASLGGTELHSRHIIDGIADQWRVTVLFPDVVTNPYTTFETVAHNEFVRVLKYPKHIAQDELVIFGHSASLQHSETEQIFAQLIRGGHVQIVHFQHLIGWRTLRLPLIAKTLGAKVVLSLHDYYLFCPVYDLLLPSGRSCGQHQPNANDPKCRNCLTHYTRPLITPEKLDDYLTQRHQQLKAMFACCDVIVAPSMYVKQCFAKVYGDQLTEKLQVIEHGIPHLGKPVSHKTAKQFRIGVFTNMTRRKGADLLIKAIQKLRQLDSDHRIHIQHHGGANETYRAQLAATGVTVCGSYSLATLRQLITAIDLAVVPSIYEETFCLTVAELQSLGVPVIAFAVGAINERIQDEVTGFLVTPITAEALAQRIMSLMTRNSALVQVRRQLRTTSPIKSLANNIADYAALYRHLIKTPALPLPIAIDLNELNPPLLDTIFTSIDPDWREWQQGYGTASYRQWLELNIKHPSPLGAVDATQFDLVIIETERLNNELNLTLASLKTAAQAGARVIIISHFDLPLTADEEPIKNIIWVKQPATHDLARVLNHWIVEQGRHWIALLPCGDRLAPNAIQIWSAYLQHTLSWRFIYFDEDMIAEDGRRYQGLFKPDCNLDLLRSHNIIGQCALIQRDAFIAVGGLRFYPHAGLYDLCLKLIDKHGVNCIGHIPHVIYHRHDRHLLSSPTAIETGTMKKALAAHLDRQQLSGTIHQTDVAGIFWIDYARPRRIAFTLIILTNGDGTQVAETIDNVRSIANHFTVTVLDFRQRAGSIWSALQQRKRDVSIQLVRVQAGNPVAAALNQAINHATTEFICITHDGIRFHTHHALNILWGLLTRTDVALAAPCILDSNNTIVHGYPIAGFWPFGAIGQLHAGETLGQAGYLQRNLCVQNCVTVTDRFFVLRRSAFHTIKGFNEQQFPNAWYLLDAGLRLTQAGYRNVWTPHATIVEIHEGSFYQQRRTTLNETEVANEVAHLYDHWLNELAHDPGYNPQLTLREFSCTPALHLVHQCDPVIYKNRPRVLGFPGDYAGSGHYRVIDPLQLLHTHGLVCATLTPEPRAARTPNVVELARLEPTTILLHNALYDQHLHALSLYSRYSEALRILSLDDLITDLPAWNPFRQTNYPDMERRLHEALVHCDRLLVSTEALATAYAAYHADILIIPNRLRRSRWCLDGKLVHDPALSASERKPRIGWAGAMQHEADLAWLAPVVAELSADVEWHFLGFCPSALQPYATSVTPMVDFAQYPHTLAALALDVAIAPLVLHDFNRCKSALRLLEFGILGVPVVCTDIEPYRHAPVERLPNDPAQWLAALRARIFDLTTTRADGAQLKRWVETHWLLDDDLDIWMTSLTK